jgi:hypothetical protein
MEILSAPARGISCAPTVFQLFQLLAFLPKNGSLFSVKIYLATKFDLTLKTGSFPSCYQKSQFLEKRI